MHEDALFDFFEQRNLFLAAVANFFLEIGVPVLPESSVSVVGMGRRYAVGDAPAHTLPAGPANHFELLRLVDRAPDEKVDPFATQITGLATDVLRCVSRTLETALSFHRLDGLLVLLAKGLFIEDDRRGGHCRTDGIHRIIVAVRTLKLLLLLSNSLAFRIAALATCCDLVPVAFPLFPPGEGPIADHANLGW